MALYSAGTTDLKAPVSSHVPNNLDITLSLFNSLKIDHAIFYHSPLAATMVEV